MYLLFKANLFSPAATYIFLPLTPSNRAQKFLAKNPPVGGDRKMIAFLNPPPALGGGLSKKSPRLQNSMGKTKLNPP